VHLVNPSDVSFGVAVITPAGRTMEAAEDGEFLDAMRRAHIRGALVGVEAVTAAGLKDVYNS
jgi:hypothetical protein